MIYIKKSASINGIKPEILLAMVVAEQVFTLFEEDLVVTSAVDSKHGQGSLHYVGYAFDCRQRGLDKDEIVAIAEIMKDRLGGDYDVVIEKDHIHVEFQPKVGLNL